MVCKCEEKDKMFKNSSINQTAIGNVGFDSEIVSTRNGKKVKKVLLTYDMTVLLHIQAWIFH